MLISKFYVSYLKNKNNESMATMMNYTCKLYEGPIRNINWLNSWYTQCSEKVVYIFSLQTISFENIPTYVNYVKTSLRSVAIEA